MANLTAGQLVGVLHDVWRRFSAEFREIPINKSQFLAFGTIVDNALEQAEIDIVQAIPAGPGKDWLMANPEVGRWLMELIEKKRREVL